MRAMSRLFVGIYLGEVCLASLIFLKLGEISAVGPLILTVLLFLITAVYHVHFSASTRPLTQHLPKSLSGTCYGSVGAKGTARTTEDARKKNTTGTHAATGDSVFEKPKRLLKKCLKPNIYLSYDQMGIFVAEHVQQTNSCNGLKVDTDAFLHPSVTSHHPTLWIPRDSAGASGEEVRATERYVPVTDFAAYFDHDGQIIWDELRVPDDVRARARI